MNLVCQFDTNILSILVDSDTYYFFIFLLDFKVVNAFASTIFDSEQRGSLVLVENFKNSFLSFSLFDKFHLSPVFAGFPLFLIVFHRLFPAPSPRFLCSFSARMFHITPCIICINKELFTLST